MRGVFFTFRVTVVRTCLLRVGCCPERAVMCESEIEKDDACAHKHMHIHTKTERPPKGLCLRPRGKRGGDLGSARAPPRWCGVELGGGIG